MIQGMRKQNWYLSLNFILCLQVSGTGRNDPFFLSPASPATLTEIITQNKTKIFSLYHEIKYFCCLPPVNIIWGVTSSKMKTVAMRRSMRLMVLTVKTILAPVVILIWHGPQQHGDSGRQHHIFKMSSSFNLMLYSASQSFIHNQRRSSWDVLINNWFKVQS